MAKQRKASEKTSAPDYAAGSLVTLSILGETTHVIRSRITMATYCGNTSSGWHFGTEDQSTCEPCMEAFKSDAGKARRF